MTALRRGWAADLHHFWFHELRPADWFGGGVAVDEEVRRRFGRWWETLRGERAERFLDNPRGALAAVRALRDHG